MHAILFGLKRAWHGSLRATRHALATVGLTAARFDLLYALQCSASLSKSQRSLRLTLGVNRTTISRMVRSLEDLGLIRRERPRHGDRRTREVQLTEQGRKRIRIAMRRLIGSGAAQLAVDTAIAGGPNHAHGESWHDGYACIFACDVLESFLKALRHAFGDFGCLYYPWHPDD